jgi:hypothetical protein
MLTVSSSACFNSRSRKLHIKKPTVKAMTKIVAVASTPTDLTGLMGMGRKISIY